MEVLIVSKPYYTKEQLDHQHAFRVARINGDAEEEERLFLEAYRSELKMAILKEIRKREESLKDSESA
jgi:hypothetical protein